MNDMYCIGGLVLPNQESRIFTVVVIMVVALVVQGWEIVHAGI